MNEQFHNSIKKAGEHISLTSAERERMRGVLHAYMEMKPVRAQQSLAHSATRGWFFTLRPVAAVLVLGLFISSAGVSYAAGDALPGDILYTVKTRINEPVRGALAVSSSAKATWATNVAGERVKEAATLAAEGRLSSTTQQELQADFEAHAQEATQAIALQASSTPDEGVEAAVRFEAQLSEYGNVLSQVGAAKQIDVTQLVSSVQAEGNRIAMVRAHTDSHIASASAGSSASMRMQVAAKQQLDDSSVLAHAGAGSLSPSSADLVAVQLQSASTSISAGEDFVAKSAIPDAFGAFRRALVTTEKLGVFLKTSSAIHARTGLVVGEPEASSTPEKTKRVNRSNPLPSNDGRREGLLAAMAPSSTTAMSATLSTGATSSEGTDSGESDASAEARTESDERVDAKSKHTLPVSVPIHLSF